MLSQWLEFPLQKSAVASQSPTHATGLVPATNTLLSLLLLLLRGDRASPPP
jgi:hypothetical protein